MKYNWIIQSIIVAVWTFVSRLFGLIREILLAGAFGAGGFMDVFFVAFRIPNLFRKIFAEGAFTAAFVPLLNEKISCKDTSNRFISSSFFSLIVILLIVSFIMIAFMPFFLKILAGGFGTGEKFEQTVFLARMLFPYIIFLSLAALFSGVLNTCGKFALAAAAPASMNIFIILGILIASRLGLNQETTLIASVLLSGAFHLALVQIYASRLGYNISFKYMKFTADSKKLILLGAPAAFAGSIYQINTLISQRIASDFDGAVSWLSYADRIYQLPLSLIGIGFTTVLLPYLSNGDFKKSLYKNNLMDIISVSLIVTLPAATGIFILSDEIIQAIYLRGNFGQLDARNTSLALQVYSIGLLAFVLLKVVQTSFFSEKNATIPLLVTIVAVISNIFISLFAYKSFGFLSAAIGLVSSGWIGLVAIAVFAYKHNKFYGVTAKDIYSVIATIIGTAVMGATISLLLKKLLKFDLPSFLVVIACIIVGVFVYGACLSIFGVVNWKSIRQHRTRG